MQQKFLILLLLCHNGLFNPMEFMPTRAVATAVEEPLTLRPIRWASLLGRLEPQRIPQQYTQE